MTELRRCWDFIRNFAQIFDDGVSEEQFPSYNNIYMAKDVDKKCESATEQPRKKRRVWLRVLIWLVVLLLLGGGVAATYYHVEKNKESEAACYDILTNNYEPADYEDFLIRFPGSVHAEEVRKRLGALRQMLNAWAAIERTGTKSDFVRFKNDFRNPRFDHLCDAKIDSLDWLSAQHIGTVAAYESYLLQHADGRYAFEAQVALEQARAVMVHPSEQAAIGDAIEGFLRAFSNNDEMSYGFYLAPTLDRFLSKTNVSHAEVAAMISAMYNEHIMSCRFSRGDTLSVTKQIVDDGKYAYQASFSIDQHIERDNDGKTYGQYAAEASFDHHYLITSFTMKEVSRR